MLIVDDENNIKLTRGDTAILDIDITDQDGNPYIMSEDESLIFTVRRLYGKGEELIRKEVTAPTIMLSTNDTKDLSFGDYRFDIYIFNSVNSNVDTFIAERIFTIGEEVHDFE